MFRYDPLNKCEALWKEYWPYVYYKKAIPDSFLAKKPSSGAINKRNFFSRNFDFMSFFLLICFILLFCKKTSEVSDFFVNLYRNSGFWLYYKDYYIGNLCKKLLLCLSV